MNDKNKNKNKNKNNNNNYNYNNDKDDLSASFRPHNVKKLDSAEATASSLPNYFFVPALKVLIMSFVPFYNFLYLSRFSRVYIQRQRIRNNKSSLKPRGFNMCWRMFWRTFLFIFVAYPMLKEMFAGLRWPRLYAGLIIGFLIFCAFAIFYNPLVFIEFTKLHHLQFIYYIINPLVFTVVQLLLNRSLRESALPVTQERACQRFNAINVIGLILAIALFVFIFISIKRYDDSPLNKVIMDKGHAWVASSKSYDSLRDAVLAGSTPDLCVFATADSAQKYTLDKYFVSKPGHNCMRQMPAILEKCVSLFPLPSGTYYSKTKATGWFHKIVLCSDVGYFNNSMLIKPEYFLRQAKSSAVAVCSVRRAKLKNKNTPVAVVIEKNCKDKQSALATSCYNKSNKTMPALISLSDEGFYSKEISDCVASGGGASNAVAAKAKPADKK